MVTKTAYRLAPYGHRKEYEGPDQQHHALEFVLLGLLHER